MCGEFSRAVDKVARTPETGWAVVRARRGGSGTTTGVLHIPPQELVFYPPIATLANVLLAALNGLRLLAPAALLGDLTKALDASLSKAFGTLLEGPRDEAQGAATAFLRLLVPFVRKGLIEGVYGSRVGNMPPGEALQEILEKMIVGKRGRDQRSSMIITSNSKLVRAQNCYHILPSLRLGVHWQIGCETIVDVSASTCQHVNLVNLGCRFSNDNSSVICADLCQLRSKRNNGDVRTHVRGQPSSEL
jgi:hypothetical protein